MSDAKAFEELELGLLLDEMQVTYLGPDESELGRLIGVCGAIDPSWLALTMQLALLQVIRARAHRRCFNPHLTQCDRPKAIRRGNRGPRKFDLVRSFLGSEIDARIVSATVALPSLVWQSCHMFEFISSEFSCQKVREFFRRDVGKLIPSSAQTCGSANCRGRCARFVCENQGNT